MLYKELDFPMTVGKALVSIIKDILRQQVDEEPSGDAAKETSIFSATKGETPGAEENDEEIVFVAKETKNKVFDESLGEEAKPEEQQHGGSLGGSAGETTETDQDKTSEAMSELEDNQPLPKNGPKHSPKSQDRSETTSEVQSMDDWTQQTHLDRQDRELDRNRTRVRVKRVSQMVLASIETDRAVSELTETASEVHKSTKQAQLHTAVMLNLDHRNRDLDQIWTRPRCHQTQGVMMDSQSEKLAEALIITRSSGSWWLKSVRMLRVWCKKGSAHMKSTEKTS